MSMLERFREAKAEELAALAETAREGRMPLPWPWPGGRRPDFAAALTRHREDGMPAVIAEYKRASPSRGVINERLEPEDVARSYAAAGAAALSVLTEATHFQGDLAYLERMMGPALPLLRKDFLIHPLQVEATAATPAAALLLIARMFPGRAATVLARMHARTLELGMAAVVEVFDEEDLALVRDHIPDVRLIQVNNRDLDRLTTDLAVSERLVASPAMGKRPDEVWISASGMDKPEDLERMAALGYDAVLVGSALMAHADPGAALSGLLTPSPRSAP